jgi:hypothetical protein
MLKKSKRGRLPGGKNADGGFIATTALMMLVFGCLALILVSNLSVRWYADSIFLRDMRLQARELLIPCMNEATEMLSRDYFLSGNIAIPEYDCSADFIKNSQDGISIMVKVQLSTVIMKGEILTRLDQNKVQVLSYRVY